MSRRETRIAADLSRPLPHDDSVKPTPRDLDAKRSVSLHSSTTRSRRALCFSPGMVVRVAAFGAMAIPLVLAACSEQYCQIGPKYGKQCYSVNDVEWQEALVGPEPEPRRSTDPAPGCAVLSQSGVTVMPQPGAGGSPSPPRGVSLMSGACVSRRAPVAGAVR
nr:MAG: hypothetical protein DIU78_16625 [Pseudomonadota bacterium]